ncbi:hypothetical protein [Phenylobacterium sp.]|uniref:hypothetical protein n=1 Tax=Phenylobacterium sp. TaxID=1871053 RepID=UPI0025ECDDF7|nr:hypothetical protein [Phenylobacterium sp.]
MALPGAALAQPSDLFYERAVMSAADTRCSLFTPEISAALAASAAQAHGAALRAGTDPKSLDSLRRTAQMRAAAVNCQSSDVTGPAARVRSAFAGYQRISRIVYPGSLSAWSADRGIGRTARWRLAQSSPFGSNQMIFGLAGREGASALVAVADFADNAAPYSARLVLRDGSRTSGPYLDNRPHTPLSSKLPPRAATRMFMAEARGGAEAELLPKGSEGAWAFRFPAAAAEALADLDPRESVAVEFLFGGDHVRTAYVEVGDFAAGRAFLQLASRSARTTLAD